MRSITGGGALSTRGLMGSLPQGLLVAVPIRRRIESCGPLRDDRLGDRDHLGIDLALDVAELRRPNLVGRPQRESPILELRSARSHPELAISLPR
jgi:hypothetical protein